MSYVPYYGGSINNQFHLQFPKARTNLISATVILIEQLSNDGQNNRISHATGFMWRNQGKLWLVSARHVFTGKNPFDGSVLSDSGYIPRIIRVHVGIGRTLGFVSKRELILPLYDDDRPLWHDDPEFESLRTDISALPIDIEDGNIVYCTNDDPNFGGHDDLVVDVGFTCHIVGYPTPHVSGLKFPIWRSGALASDPALPIDGKPIFLVDAATGPGFSGSPVYRVHFGPAPHYDDSVDTGIRIDTSSVRRVSFVGVYSGRLDHPHQGAQTPYVFYGNRVSIIVSSAAPIAFAKPI